MVMVSAAVERAGNATTASGSTPIVTGTIRGRGVGGTGGAAARDLVASGVGHLHCVEPDVVELSNLNRQTLFREDDLGRPKLDAALAALREPQGRLQFAHSDLSAYSVFEEAFTHGVRAANQVLRASGKARSKV